MKLRTDYYDYNTIEVLSSRMSKNMNSQVAIYTNNTGEYLAEKIFSILKREFAIVIIQKENKISRYPVIDICDISCFCAFVEYSKIETLIFTSEMIIEEIGNSCGEKLVEGLEKICLFCQKRKIKVVYVNVLNPFSFETDKNRFYGINDDSYSIINNKIVHIISNTSENLIFTLSTYYGCDSTENYKDFPYYVLLKLINHTKVIYDNVIKLSPLISDEVGNCILDNMDFQENINISNSSESITEYEWALKVARHYQYSFADIDGFIICKNEIEGKKEKRQDTQFSSVEKGLTIRKKQEKCLLKLIYKLKPTDFFLGESVAEIRIDLGKQLAMSIKSEIVAKIDYVVPVPQTGMYYAMGVAMQIEKPYIQALQKDTGDIRSFEIHNNDIRKEIVRKRITPIKELIKGKRLLVIDEAIFTGTTLKQISKMLHQCDVEEIHFAIPTPECWEQCQNYMQPQRTMLLEYVRKDMLDEYFDVDTVSFQKFDDFNNIISRFNGICKECFDN